jgi:hypothetical protein
LSEWPSVYTGAYGWLQVPHVLGGIVGQRHASVCVGARCRSAVGLRPTCGLLCLAVWRLCLACSSGLACCGSEVRFAQCDAAVEAICGCMLEYPPDGHSALCITPPYSSAVSLSTQCIFASLPSSSTWSLYICSCAPAAIAAAFLQRCDGACVGQAPSRPADQGDQGSRRAHQDD